MSASEPESASDYHPPDDSQPWADERPSSPLRSSPRKRRRSSETLPGPKRQLVGQYNDGYRQLYNADVEAAAAARFNTSAPLHAHSTAQIGASLWTRDEKTVFFAALERLGKDNLPGIASAIGTKSIPQVREFALLLADAAAKNDLHWDARATLYDIPAAIEISTSCSERLELAADTLARYQERFEARQEMERHGDYWLITPEIAQEVEAILNPSRPPSMASSPPPRSDDERQAGDNDINEPQLLRDIPEAKLLVPSTMLQLSASLFMNGSDMPPSPQPHWSAFQSDFASEPSIFRTAFNDFHNLVLSLTKRLMQASLIQATARVRSQGWRHGHGVQPLVKKRDVHAAADMLHLSRDSQDRWRGVARRCGLRVFEYKKKREGTWQDEKFMSWDEIEELFDKSVRRPRGTDELTSEPMYGTADVDFKARAGRSGTPLPEGRLGISDSESDHPDPEWEEDSVVDDLDEQRSQASDDDGSVSLKSEGETSRAEQMTLEEFDQEASRQELLKLEEVLGAMPLNQNADEPTVEEEDDDVELPFVTDDWREWTQYHAEWETFAVPVPAAAFGVNCKPDDPSVPLGIAGQAAPDNAESGYSSGENGQPRRSKRAVTELPIRGSRAYAAWESRRIAPANRESEAADTDDDAEFPAPSVERDIDAYGAVSPVGGSDDDAKPASPFEDD